MSEPFQGSASVPTLRYPRPQGNQRLANWISSSSPDIMAHTFVAGDDYMAESSYELINTDDETDSQDGLTAGSTASSLDLIARPSDEDCLSGIDPTQEYETQDEEIVITQRLEEDTEEEDCTEQWETRSRDVAAATDALIYTRGMKKDGSHGGQLETTLGLYSITNKADKGYFASCLVDSDVTETPTESRKPIVKDAAPSPIGDRARRLARDLGLQSNVRIVALVVVSMVAFTLLNVIATTLFWSSGKACQQLAVPNNQAQPPMVTSFATRPPTTVTATVTSTSTVQLPIFSAITKKIATSADEIAKKVDISSNSLHRMTEAFERTLAKAKVLSKARLERHVQTAGDLAGDMNMAVLKAQIKSRLIWLQIQGKMKEYDSYQTKAKSYLKAKHRQMMISRVHRDRKATVSTSWGRILRRTLH